MIGVVGAEGVVVQEWLVGPVAALGLALYILWQGIKEEPGWYKRSEYLALEKRRQDDAAEAARRLQQVQDDANETISEWKLRAERWERIAYSFTDLGERFARVLELEKGPNQ
jgi:glycine/D-amino acid oxidase-like deaminating enzyme